MTTPEANRPLTGDDVKRPAGHCDDDAAWAEFVRQYDGKPRSYPQWTDFALANAVFMASRNDLDLIVYQTAAKERIRWLSIRLSTAERQRDEAPLWMMHARGPDDVYPAPDYETALRWSDRANEIGEEIKAVPALWTGTPESHAETLAASIAGWTVNARSALNEGG